jgi:hypothetical protein
MKGGEFATSREVNWRNISITLINRWTKALLLRRVGWRLHYRCAFRNHRVADALVLRIGVATLDLAESHGHRHHIDQRAPIRAV